MHSSYVCDIVSHQRLVRPEILNVPFSCPFSPIPLPSGVPLRPQDHLGRCYPSTGLTETPGLTETLSRAMPESGLPSVAVKVTAVVPDSATNVPAKVK